MELSEEDYLDYMSKLENNILNSALKIQELNCALNKIESGIYQGILKKEDITNLIEDFKRFQKRDFEQFKKLNKPSKGTPEGKIEFFNSRKIKELKDLLM